MEGWKTLIFALIVTILGALETFDFTQWLTPDIAGIVTMVIGVLIAAFRAITKTPIALLNK